MSKLEVLAIESVVRQIENPQNIFLLKNEITNSLLKRFCGRMVRCNGEWFGIK